MSCRFYQIIAFFLLTFSVNSFSFSQDTLSITLQPFQLIESRLHQLPGFSYISPDSSFLATNPSKTLAYALEYLTPAYVRSYGNGASSTFTLRGVGADKVNVVWNGFIVNSGSLGLFDLSLLPTIHANNLQIIKGSSSSLTGNGAVGATILSHQYPVFQKSWKIVTHQELGMYGFIANSSSAHYSSEKFFTSTQFTWNQAKNNFLYQDNSLPNAPWLPMPQASFFQTTISHQSSCKISNAHQLTINALYNFQNREIPPAIGAALSSDRQKDLNFRITLNGNHAWGKKKNELSHWGIAYLKDDILYSNNNFIDSTTIHQLQTYYTQQTTRWKKLLIEAQIHYQLFLPKFKAYPDNVAEHRISLSTSVIWDILPVWKIIYAIKQQFIPGFNPPLTGTIGTDGLIFKKYQFSIGLKGNVSNGYRVPTLNDRYWTPGGNPDLKPEFSWNTEGSIYTSWYKKNIQINIEATFFSLWVNNWILWQPQPAGYWSPVNKQNVNSLGLETSFNGKFSFANHAFYILTIQHHFTRTRSLAPHEDSYQLIYIPPHTISMVQHLYFKNFFINIACKYSDIRFIRQDNSKYLPAFFIGNLMFGKVFPLPFIQLTTQVQINNFTNTQYQSIENRPMPGIQVLGAIYVELNNHHVKQKKVIN